MRFIKNIEDANHALRELFDFYDNLRNRNYDLHRKRIINAHPSIDDYDYVVRKELIDTIGEAFTARGIPKRKGNQPTVITPPGGPPPSTTTPTVRYDKITFGIGIGRSVEVGDDVTPPYIWTNSSNGKPKIIAAAANIPPIGDDLEFDILHNGSNFISFSLPQGTGSKVVVHSGVTTQPTITRYDVVSCNVTQTGGTEGGRDVEIVLFCELV